jgi:ketosteroid isomerase-like protein
MGMLLSVLVLSALVSGVRADDAAVRKALDAQYAKFSQGMIKKDMKAMFSLLTPDATFKEVGGQIMTREQMSKMMEQMMGTMTISKIGNKVETLKVKGNTAIADVTSRSSGKMKGQDGKTHTVAYVSKSRDTWTKTAGGWKLKRIEAISETMTMDGKPVSYGAPPPKK